MKVKASEVREGDRVQGIGLVVEFSEPHSDFTHALVGRVHTRDANGEVEQFATTLILPNDHMVRVSRPFKVGDRVTVPVVENGDEEVGVQYVEASVVALQSATGEAEEGTAPEPDGVVIQFGDGATNFYRFRDTRHAPATAQ